MKNGSNFLPSVKITFHGNNVTILEEMIENKIVTRVDKEGPLNNDNVRFNFTELRKYISPQIRME